MTLILLVVVGALIGWGTNKMAIYLLFNPKSQINFKLFKLQGLIPKRQEEIAKKIAAIVSTELINSPLGEIETKKEMITDIIVDNINSYAKNFIEKYPLIAITGALLQKDAIREFKNKVRGEIKTKLDVIVEKVLQDTDIEQEVYDKISSYSLEELENLVKTIANKEFKAIEILGGLLGSLIGFVQFIIVALM